MADEMRRDIVPLAMKHIVATGTPKCAKLCLHRIEHFMIDW